MPINIQTVKDQPRFTFSELSDEAKVFAKSEIVNDETLAWKQMIDRYKALPLHQRINRKSFYGLHFVSKPMFLKKPIYIKRIQNESQYFICFVEQNHCMFLQDGTYILFCS